MSQIFNINLETGDLSQFDTVVSGGSNVISAVSPGLIGSGYKLSCEVNDTNTMYAQKDFTQLVSGIYRLRRYFNSNALTMASGDIFDIGRVQSGTSYRALLRLLYQSGSYKLKLRTVQDGSINADTNYYDLSDEEHYIEFLVQYASSASASDGQAALWFDGQQQETLTGLDIFDISQPDNLRVGAVNGLDTGTSGTFLLDEILLNDDGSEIGAIEPPTTEAPPVKFGRQKARLDLFESLTFALAEHDVSLSPMSRWLAYFGVDYLNQRWMWTWEGQPVSDAQWEEIEQHLDLAFREIMTQI